MAAGDIIFEDGTIITPADLEKLIPLITNALGSTAKDPSEYPILERLDDLTSLPVFDAAYNLGRVSILRLKGVNGKNAILRVQGDMLQWSLEGTDIWNDLYSKSELKGDPGAAANMEIGEVTSGDTPAATITGEAPNYKLNLVLVPGGKGDTGDNGKTPVLASVSAQSGETASGNFTEDGFDESGNPKYILDLTLPKGQDGQPAIFEQGTTTTVDPDASASVDVLPNGETAEGNPKYILNFSIPRGQKGAPGEGAGNLLADVSAVTIGKKYLLSPIADGSSEVNMVEYTPPSNATSESAGLMTSDQFQKLEKLNPSSLSNDVTGKKVEYTDDGKLLFEDKETFAVDADGNLTLDGKKMSELGGSGTYILPTGLFDLTSSNTSNEISEVIGGVEGFNAIYNAISNKKVIFAMSYESDMPHAEIVVYQYNVEVQDLAGIYLQTTNKTIVIGNENGVFGLESTGSGPFVNAYSGVNIPYNENGNIEMIKADSFNEKNRLYLVYEPIKNGSYDTHEKVERLLLDCHPIKQILDIYTDRSVYNALKLVLMGSIPVQVLIWGAIGGNKSTRIVPYVYEETVENSTYGGFVAFVSHLNGRVYTIKITEDTSGQLSIEANDVESSSELSAATSDNLGGIKIGYTTSGKNYPVQLDGSDKAYVNVPWTDTNTTYDLATTSANGLMSSIDKTKLDKVDSYVTASSISNLDVTKKVIYVALTANGSLSANNVGAAYNGQSFSVKIYCSAARTITIPTSGNYVSMCGSSYTCPAGKRVEFHFEGINGQWWIAKLEQE